MAIWKGNRGKQDKQSFFEISQQIKYIEFVVVKFHHEKTDNFGKKDVFIFTK